MPVQMIEIEEVKMIETSDEALEATGVVVGGLGGSTWPPYCGWSTI